MNDQNNQLNSNNSNSLNKVGVIPSVPIITPDMVHSNLNSVSNNLNSQVVMGNSISGDNLENSNIQTSNVLKDDNWAINNKSVEDSISNIDSVPVQQLSDNIINNSFVQENLSVNIQNNNNEQQVNNTFSNSVSNDSAVNFNDELGLDSLYVSNSAHEQLANNNIQTESFRDLNQPNSSSNLEQPVNQNIVQNSENIISTIAEQESNVQFSDNNSNTENTIIENVVSNNNLSQPVLNIQNNNNVISNDELVINFVGEKYDKIKNSSFSLPCFFFGISYLLYRKMYLYAFLTLLVCFTPVGLVANIVLAIFINKWYLKFASKKVEKIKVNNPGKTSDELKTICSKKGGTSVGAIILGTLLMYVIIFVPIIFLWMSYNLVIKNAVSKPLPNDNDNNIINDNNSDLNEYNGVIVNDTSVVIDDIFDVEIPNDFIDDSFGKYKYEYEYFADSNSSFSDCDFSLGAVNNYDSAEGLSNQMAKYYGNLVINKKIINEINWYTFTDVSNFDTKYYYLTDKDNKVYLYQFTMDEEYLDVCEPYHNTIINSIKLK